MNQNTPSCSLTGEHTSESEVKKNPTHTTNSKRRTMCAKTVQNIDIRIQRAKTPTANGHKAYIEIFSTIFGECVIKCFRFVSLDYLVLGSVFCCPCYHFFSNRWLPSINLGVISLQWKTFKLKMTAISGSSSSSEEYCFGTTKMHRPS